ncbi:MAG: hypothetical protein M0P41_06875, partial [Sphaerochaeta sp.]|nr:hypothetical protein [Sphaerochaeta sp.]
MKRTTILLLVLVLSLGTLSARENSVAVGAQLGFTTTGVLVDVGLGDLYLQAGVNYPMGISYIAAYADDDNVFNNIFTFNADISQAFALSENFDMKIGLGTTAFTNFGPVVLGLAGAVVKGEYW